VNGVEDHGYRIDIGVSNITAFMPKTGTDKGKGGCIQVSAL